MKILLLSILLCIFICVICYIFEIINKKLNKFEEIILKDYENYIAFNKEVINLNQDIIKLNTKLIYNILARLEKIVPNETENKE